MSQTSPRASGQPSSTPCAESRASSSPSMTQSFSPVSFSTALRKAGPSLASRTAAVATQVRGLMPMPSARAAKRFSAAMPRAAPSGFSMPVVASPCPSPAMTFSL